MRLAGQFTFKKSLLFVGLMLFPVGTAEAISLQEAIKKAVTEYPSIGVAVKRSNAETYRVEQAYSDLLPKIDLDADVGKQMVDQPEVKLPDENKVWRQRSQATFTGRLVLFDGYQRANAIYRNEARLEASSMVVLESAEAVALQVAEAYIDHRRHTFLLRIADENIATHEKLLQLVQDRVAGGRATQSAVQQVEERLYGAQVIRAEVLQSLYEANAKFKALVGIEPRNTSPVQFPSDLPISSTAALDLAIDQNPTIAALGLEAEAMDYDVERIRGEFMPTVSLEGRGQFGDDIDGDPGKNNDYSVQLRLSWRLYDGGQIRARTREASELAGAAFLERDLSIRRIQERIDAAYGKLKALDQRIAASDRQTKAARSLVQSYKTEFEANRISILDLLDAERSVAASRFEYASVSGVKLFNGYTIKALTGTLLRSMGVSPDFAALEKPKTIGLPGVGTSDFYIEPLQ